MNEIQCQAKHEEGKGCSTCGGYLIVLQRSQCAICKRPNWVRPGVYTSFEGKRWTTFDGMTMVCRAAGFRCTECDEGEGRGGG